MGGRRQQVARPSPPVINNTRSPVGRMIILASVPIPTFTLVSVVAAGMGVSSQAERNKRGRSKYLIWLSF